VTLTDEGDFSEDFPDELTWRERRRYTMEELVYRLVPYEVAPPEPRK